MIPRGGIVSGCLSLALLAGCNSAPVKDLDSSADTRTLNEDQRRMWYASEQLDDSIRKRSLVYHDAQLAAYVQSVLDSLYPEFDGTLKVQLFDSPHLNAFCLPNGHIYFNIGLLARLDNEAQMATILAHEAAHFIRQHSVRRRNSADGAVMFGVAFQVLTGIPFTGSLLTQGILSGYSQAHENQADSDGFQRLVKSGYDAREAPKTFEKLLEEVKALDIDQPFMFSSHPKLENRIASFNRLIEEQEHPEGKLNTEQFLALTHDLREATLHRYLDMNNHKVLLLILENESMRQRYPRHADYYLGEAYRLRGEDGDTDKAIAAFRESIRLAPDFPHSYRALGVLLMKQGEDREAKEAFEAYLSRAPEAQDRGYVEQYLNNLDS